MNYWTGEFIVAGLYIKSHTLLLQAFAHRFFVREISRTNSLAHTLASNSILCTPYRTCKSHLARKDELLSKEFRSRTGPAWLFNRCVHVNAYELAFWRNKAVHSEVLLWNHSFDGYTYTSMLRAGYSHIERTPLLTCSDSAHVIYVHTLTPLPLPSVINVVSGPKEERKMTTGTHVVSDIFCVVRNSKASTVDLEMNNE